MAEKYQKKARRRYKKYLAKPQKTYFKCGDYHNVTYQIDDRDYRVDTHTNFGPGNAAEDIATDITLGDLFENRRSNLIYVKNIQLLLNIRNTASEARLFKVIVTYDKGTSSSPNIDNFLVEPQTYTPVTYTGRDEMMLKKINGEFFGKTLFSKVGLLPGLDDEEVRTRSYTMNLPINRYVSYKYNSNIARKGRIYVFIMFTSAPGVTPGVSVINTSWRMTTHFHDVHRVIDLYGKKRYKPKVGKAIS